VKDLNEDNHPYLVGRATYEDIINRDDSTVLIDALPAGGKVKRYYPKSSHVFPIQFTCPGIACSIP
jgi:hypothetical protein